MVNAWWCSTTFSSCTLGILEQPVSRIVDRKRWNDSMVWSCLCVHSLRFLSLGTSEVLCWCYRRHTTSGTDNNQNRTNSRWFEGHLEFSNELVTSSDVHVLRWSSRWTLWTHSLTLRRPWTGNHASEGLLSYNSYFLHCGVYSTYVGLALQFFFNSVFVSVFISVASQQLLVWQQTKLSKLRHSCWVIQD